jgi:hypothetical protein
MFGETLIEKYFAQERLDPKRHKQEDYDAAKIRSDEAKQELRKKLLSIGKQIEEMKTQFIAVGKIMTDRDSRAATAAAGRRIMIPMNEQQQMEKNARSLREKVDLLKREIDEIK